MATKTAPPPAGTSVFKWISFVLLRKEPSVLPMSDPAPEPSR